MYWLNLAIKNILHRPLSAFLSILLFTLATGMIIFLTQINDQIKSKFEKNLAGVDLVIGAKGSPLQMILCNMYHIDAPTGNVKISEVAPFLRKGHPLIKASVPLSLGDSHKGYRIVGTNQDFIERYKGTIALGTLWQKTMDVVVGHTVAERLELLIGSQFQSAHGLSDNDDMIHTDAPPFEVTGVLEKNGSVLDQLILTPSQSVWYVHESHDHDETDSSAHDYSKLTPLLDLVDSDKEITSVLVEFNGRSYQSLNMARNINENTNLMAASPAIEMNRLYAMMGVGVDAMEYLVYIMALVALISVFISLLQSLKARKYEIAVLKVQGAASWQVFWSTCLEAMIVALIGALLGVLTGKLAIALLGDSLEKTYKYSFEAWTWSIKDIYVILIAIGLAILAAIIPAWSAGNTNIHQTLSDK